MCEIGGYNKLSIVIPAYNAEIYIKRCIDKVLKIDLKKEIIVINDGSTDNSLDILKEYKNQIVLINSKDNKGVSYARNLGIEKATGDYIAFIDIDDDFELDMHKTLLLKMLERHSDISFCEFNVINNGHKYNSKYKLDFGNISKHEAVSKYLTDNIFPSVWSSVYSTTLVKSICFDERLNVAEDTLFVLRCLLAAKNPIFINEILYHYMQQEKSILHTINDKIIQSACVVKMIPLNEIKILETNYPEEFEYFKLQMIYRAVNAVSLASKLRTRKLGACMIKKVCSKEDCLAIAHNRFSRRYIKIEFSILAKFGARFHLAVFPMYKFIRFIIRR